MSETLQRYGIALGLGAFVTLILFYIMQAVIATDEARLDEGAQGRLLDFVRLEEDQDLQTKQRNRIATLVSLLAIAALCRLVLLPHL